MAEPIMKATLTADTGRGTKAILDLGALRHNLKLLRSRAQGCRVMAVVKANAYGHGIEEVVGALGDVDGFAVATLTEAARVRSVTESHRVLLLEGVLNEQDLRTAERLDLWIVAHSERQLKLLEAARPESPFRVWLKVDTGMHRLGFRAEAAREAWATLQALDSVHPDVVLMSHLANADDLNDTRSQIQIDRFRSLCRELSPECCSLANSAGVLGWPDSHYDWVRVGLALYGASPLVDRTWRDIGLEPCMTLESTLIAINDCRRGDAVGYGGVWRCPDDMPVGIVGIGYGDGYPRHADNGTPVSIGGRLCPIVGRVSMDMLAVDLRHAPDAEIGDRVELWGRELPVEVVAHRAGTIPYELLCSVTARVPVEYVGAGANGEE